MADRNVFDRYLLALRKTPIDEKTEHTDRSALEALLQTIADDSKSSAAVQHEPKHVAGKGAPDFKVTRKGLIWINKDHIQGKTLCHVIDFYKRKFGLRDKSTGQIAERRQDFFSTTPEGIRRSQHVRGLFV